MAGAVVGGEGRGVRSDTAQALLQPDQACRSVCPGVSYAAIDLPRIDRNALHVTAPSTSVPPASASVLGRSW